LGTESAEYLNLSLTSKGRIASTHFIENRLGKEN
jgi:hypothetical protein